MKRVVMSLLFAATLFFAATTNAMAYLALPDVLFNHIGEAHYDGADNLSITALTHNLTFDGINTYAFAPIFSVSGTVFNAHLNTIAGNKWYFGSAGGSTSDILIKGTPYVFPGQPDLPSEFTDNGTLTGTLIRGTILDLVLDTARNTVFGTFMITGGDLAPFYADSAYRGMFSMTFGFPDNTTVRPTDADTPWNAKGLMGEIAPVPEPSALLMIGTGLLGLLGFARRKNG